MITIRHSSLFWRHFYLHKHNPSPKLSITPNHFCQKHVNITSKFTWQLSQSQHSQVTSQLAGKKWVPPSCVHRGNLALFRRTIEAGSWSVLLLYFPRWLPANDRDLWARKTRKWYDNVKCGSPWCMKIWCCTASQTSNENTGDDLVMESKNKNKWSHEDVIYSIESPEKM